MNGKKNPSSLLHIRLSESSMATLPRIYQQDDDDDDDDTIVATTLGEKGSTTKKEILLARSLARLPRGKLCTHCSAES